VIASISIPALFVKRTKNKDKIVVIASGTSGRKNYVLLPHMKNKRKGNRCAIINLISFLP
jgi:hypothetical protein